MRILSYRGPATAGGVSSTLTQLNTLLHGPEWWFIKNAGIHRRNEFGEHCVLSMPIDIVSGHYNYCNNFLWPVLHEMPERAHYFSSEWQSYKIFNSMVATSLNAWSQPSSELVFVNDYQLAFVPLYVSEKCKSQVFWHIPWPERIEPVHVPALAELAGGLLAADTIGFHIRDYADSFAEFVRQHLQNYAISVEGNHIIQHGQPYATKTTLRACPLGLDLGKWCALAAAAQHRNSILPSGIPYVLSVDRCDYTKGIAERLTAIDRFFVEHHEWIKKVQFVQVVTRSREGLLEFDNYWDSCKSRYDELNLKWSSGAWQPLMWVEKSQSPGQLASLYRNATVMLVNPLLDGLNLAAKEFVACQSERSPGTLVLSKGAGVSRELVGGFITVNPDSPSEFANSISEGLKAPHSKRQNLFEILKSKVGENTLEDWWLEFAEGNRVSLSQATRGFAVDKGSRRGSVSAI